VECISYVGGEPLRLDLANDQRALLARVLALRSATPSPSSGRPGVLGEDRSRPAPDGRLLGRWASTNCSAGWARGGMGVVYGRGSRRWAGKGGAEMPVAPRRREGGGAIRP